MNDNKNTATCAVCGKPYKPCLSCRSQNRISYWRNIADSINCYKIFLAVSQYNNGYLSKAEAKEQLEASPFDENDLREPVRVKVAEIMEG